MSADETRPGPQAAPSNGAPGRDSGASEAAGVDPARALLARLRTDARSAGLRPGAPAGPGARRRAAADRRSGPYPDDRDPQQLGSAAARLTADRGWETELAVGGVMARWDSIVGAEVAAHCAPEQHADGVLTVRADSTAWATQVRLLAPTLVRRLNEECGQGTVARVTVLGPGRPSWRKGALHVRGRGPRDTYG